MMTLDEILQTRDEFISSLNSNTLLLLQAYGLGYSEDPEECTIRLYFQPDYIEEIKSLLPKVYKGLEIIIIPIEELFAQ